jgi:transcriptional regulator with GAF, ATPase, and Fis domain
MEKLKHSASVDKINRRAFLVRQWAMDSHDPRVQFAAVARQLLAEPGEEQTLERGVALTVELIEACGHAGVSMVQAKRLVTAAATSERVRQIDELQHELKEGPCVRSLRQEQMISSPDLTRDKRWPSWGRRVVEEVGVRSLLCFQLYADHDSLGSLNLYSEQVAAFDGEAQAVGQTLAVQIAVALHTSRKIETQARGILNRTVIGQAQGILMERFDLSADRAFEVLRRISQDSNTKLLDVAGDLVRVRCLPRSNSA